jgi:PKD repeat protein
MKKLIYLLIILPLLLISCNKSPDPPIAEFTMEVTGDPEVGKELRFINNSSNAVSFDWDFGDGYGSDEDEPDYTYNSTGTFTVTLTATGEDGDEDKAELVINVFVPTLLVVEVRDIDDQTIVYTNASVLIYESLSNWETGDPSNSLIEGFTDDYGIAVFANIDPYVYYVDALAGDYNNWMLGLDFIRTNEVRTHQINWFVAWVELNPEKKGGVARGEARIVPKSITKRPLGPIVNKYNGTDNWRELYDRRINK